MQVKGINDTFAVSPQLWPQEVAEIATAGYRTIICNRPDAEDAGQPTFAAIASAAQDCGITAHFLPVVSGGMGEREVTRMGELLRQSQQPVLAYCRSGTRSTLLWALSEAAYGADRSLLVRAAAQAGYDIADLIPHR